MRSYRTPGVYFESVLPPVRGRGAGLRMDVAGFVGIAARGEIGVPAQMESWSHFREVFGPPIPQGHLGHAVKGFFDNGGQTCWVVRAADPELARFASATLMDDSGNVGLLELTARTEGVWAHELVATVTPRGKCFDLTLVLPGEQFEVWRNLTLPPLGCRPVGETGWADTIINEHSRLVAARRLAPPVPPLDASGPAVICAREGGFGQARRARRLR